MGFREVFNRTKVGFTAHYPEIAFGVGLICDIVAMVGLVKQTLEMDDIMNEHLEAIDTINDWTLEGVNDDGEVYTEEKALADKTNVYKRTLKKTAINYSWPLLFATAGKVAEFSCYRDLKIKYTDTAAVLAGALATMRNKDRNDIPLTASENEERKIVGEERAEKLLDIGDGEHEAVVDDNGNVVNWNEFVKNMSPFAVIFDSRSSEFDENDMLGNWHVVKSVGQELNQKLKNRSLVNKNGVGYVHDYELRDLLGVERLENSFRYGSTRTRDGESNIPGGDGYIQLKVTEISYKDIFNNSHPALIIEPNWDGDITNYMGLNKKA